MSMPTRIGSFKGSWSFLSNFFPGEVSLWATATNVFANQAKAFEFAVCATIETYASVEHAYQASKFLDPKIRARFQWPMSPGQAKTLAYELRDQIRADWKEVNLGIMKDLLVQKFTPSILRRKLLATFQAELIEGNWWHDNFWGDCLCEDCEDKPGLNHLGKTLMEVRAEIYARGLRKD